MVSETSAHLKDKNTLRKQMRQQRRKLTPLQKKMASRALVCQLSTHPQLLKSRHIALYVGNDGEIDPFPLISILRKRRKQFYLPVLHPLKHNRLWFCRISANTPFRRNRFGIREPVAEHCPKINPAFLSLVLLPLVAFDKQGNRLGMGGGFYDRTFAFKKRFRFSRPGLIGLAHDFQEVEGLACERWDIPLEGVITDRRWYRFKG